MYKKCFLTVVIATILCSLCGCGENLEVRERAFVQGMGIKKDDQITVCVHVFDNTEEGHEYTGSGNTLKAAIDDAEKTQGKDFFAGHTEIAVIDKNQSEYILKELIDTDISPGCIIMYSDDPVGFVEKNDTVKVLDILETAVRNKIAEEVNICDVFNKNRRDEK